jgi:hypothetical protein
MTRQPCTCGSYPGSLCPHPVRCGIADDQVPGQIQKTPSMFEVVKEELSAINPEALLWDGFEDALVGVCHRFGQQPLALYDREQCIQIMVSRDGMSPAEANECFEFNTAGAWAGLNTPAYVTFVSAEGDLVPMSELLAASVH